MEFKLLSEPQNRHNIVLHCLLIDSPNLASLETEMKKDLANIYNWSIANKLSLNPSKWNHLIVSPKQNYTKSQFRLNC